MAWARVCVLISLIVIVLKSAWIQCKTGSWKNENNYPLLTEPARAVAGILVTGAINQLVRSCWANCGRSGHMSLGGCTCMDGVGRVSNVHSPHPPVPYNPLTQGFQVSYTFLWMPSSPRVFSFKNNLLLQ